jgi:Protein of unknown function (DUF3618)
MTQTEKTKAKSDAVAEAAAKPSRSPEEVAAEMAEARQRLVGQVGAIKDKVNPVNITQRRLASVRRIWVSDEGDVNIRNVAITVGVVALLVAYRIRK